MPRRILTNEGTTAIEFALVAPVFLLIVMGLIETGIILFMRSAMEAAMSAGAHLSSIDLGTGLTREAYIRQEAQRMTGGLMNAQAISISTQVFGGAGGASAYPGGAGAVVVYRASYPWHIVTPLIGRLIGDPSGDIQIVSVSMTRNPLD